MLKWPFGPRLLGILGSARPGFDGLYDMHYASLDLSLPVRREIDRSRLPWIPIRAPFSRGPKLFCLFFAKRPQKDSLLTLGLLFHCFSPAARRIPNHGPILREHRIQGHSMARRLISKQGIPVAPKSVS